AAVAVADLGLEFSATGAHVLHLRQIDAHAAGTCGVGEPHVQRAPGLHAHAARTGVDHHALERAEVTVEFHAARARVDLKLAHVAEIATVHAAGAGVDADAA